MSTVWLATFGELIRALWTFPTSGSAPALAWRRAAARRATGWMAQSGAADGRGFGFVIGRLRSGGDRGARRRTVRQQDRREIAEPGLRLPGPVMRLGIVELGRQVSGH